MEKFSALLAICAGNSPALVFSLICAQINGWVNNREVGDLKRRRAHYGVIVMINYVTKAISMNFIYIFSSQIYLGDHFG